MYIFGKKCLNKHPQNIHLYGKVTYMWLKKESKISKAIKNITYICTCKHFFFYFRYNIAYLNHKHNSYVRRPPESDSRMMHIVHFLIYKGGQRSWQF